MSALAEAFPEVFALPRDQRAALADALLESLDAKPDTDDLPPAFVEELRRRSAECRANPDIGVPWEVVEAAAAARRKR